MLPHNWLIGYLHECAGVSIEVAGKCFIRLILHSERLSSSIYFSIPAQFRALFFILFFLDWILLWLLELLQQKKSCELGFFFFFPSSQYLAASTLGLH